MPVAAGTPPVRLDPPELGAMIAPDRMALLVVDVQHDFAHPDGAMGRLGLDLSAASAAIVFARVVSRPQTDTRALAICRYGTPGLEYHRVAPLPGDLEIEKTLFSRFAGTALDEQLCARDAFYRDYNVFIVADACAAYDIATHEGALHDLGKNCAIVTGADELVAAWANAA